MPENLYGSLLPQNTSIYNSGSTALQSNANTGNIFGGTLAEQEESASLHSYGGGDSGGFNVGNSLGQLGSMAANSGEVTSSNVRDKTTLSYASKGAQLGSKLGPWGALIGGIGGGIYGFTQGGEIERKMKHHERNVISTGGLVSQMQSNSKDSQSSVSDFWQGQKNATENAYSVGHIDNFLQKNRV